MLLSTLVHGRKCFIQKKGFFWKNWAKIPLKICGKVYEIFEHITERFSRFWKITASDVHKSVDFYNFHKKILHM